MRTTIAFLAETPRSPRIEEQQKGLAPDDIEVLATGRKTFNHLERLLELHGIRLKAGDRVKVYDIRCISLATHMLIRAVKQLLQDGISFEVRKPGIVIEPDGDGNLHILLDILDVHYRHIHGIKTHPPDMAPSGRKRLIDSDKLPEIRAKLSEPGATTAEVAQSLGVARSTLFNYLERHDVDRRLNRHKKEARSHS